MNAVKYLIRCLADDRHDWAYRLGLVKSQLKYSLLGI